MIDHLNRHKIYPSQCPEPKPEAERESGQMTQEEAANVLQSLTYDDYDKRNDEAVSMAIKALRGPAPGHASTDFKEAT